MLRNDESADFLATPGSRGFDRREGARSVSTAVALAVALLLGGCGGGERAGSSVDAELAAAATALSADEDDDANVDDTMAVDRGVAVSRASRLGITSVKSSFAPLNGGPLAHLQGAFGPVIGWPLIAIHAVLLPDGRVMTYGTNLKGNGGADLNYSVWDPALGGGAESMLNLPNTTLTNIFCGGQLVVPGTGEVLLLGGTRVDEYARSGYGVADVGLFSPASNTMTRQSESMADKRWYGTIVTTADGDQVVLGGRADKGYPATTSIPDETVAVYAPAPAVYRTGAGWRTLSTASSDVAYGKSANSWDYPRAWLAPNGSIFVLGHKGTMFSLDSAGTGSLTTYPGTTLASSSSRSSAMFAPGKILSLRVSKQAVVVDINGPSPIVTPTTRLSADRQTGIATVLADGQVWANGGSEIRLDLSTAIYHSEIWNPQTGVWTTAASATKARLYHSSALLLPDASVLTAGGGRPGPVKNLNAEVYFPPYLFKRDGSGEFAERPVITGLPERTFAWGEEVSIGLSAGTQVSRMTLVRSGSMTHSFNNEQRFMDVAFVQDGSSVSFSTPSDRNVAPPGYYLLFVFDTDGVPSAGKILRIY